MYPPEIGGKMPEKRKKGQHLTWENRQEIQLGLKNHLSFAAIADVIGCSPDTISKEIRKHRYFKERTKTAGNIMISVWQLIVRICFFFMKS